MREIAGFEERLADFEALNAQVVGVSADHVATLEAFTKANGTRHLLLSDFRRQMLPAWGAMVTEEKSPIYRYARRAYFVLDRQGTVRWAKVQDNPLDLLKAEEVLEALKSSGAS
jgi:peroxiredoxin